MERNRRCSFRRQPGGLQIVVMPMIDNNGIPGSTPHMV